MLGCALSRTERSMVLRVHPNPSLRNDLLLRLPSCAFLSPCSLLAPPHARTLVGWSVCGRSIDSKRVKSYNPERVGIRIELGMYVCRLHTYMYRDRYIHTGTGTGTGTYIHACMHANKQETRRKEGPAETDSELSPVTEISSSPSIVPRGAFGSLAPVSLRTS